MKITSRQSPSAELGIADILRYSADAPAFIREQCMCPSVGQEQLFETITRHGATICKARRASGLTSALLSYALWHVTFRLGETVSFATSSHSGAIAAKECFENIMNDLPALLQVPVRTSDATSIQFEGGGRLMFQAISTKASFSAPMHLCVVDCFALLPDAMQQDVVVSVVPYLLEGSKLIIGSSQVAADDTFSELCAAAEAWDNFFFAYHALV